MECFYGSSVQCFYGSSVELFSVRLMMSVIWLSFVHNLTYLNFFKSLFSLLLGFL